MQGIFVDIKNELNEIASEVAMLEQSIGIYDQAAPKADAAWRWLTVQGLASAIEKVYTGCERVMAMIATDIDGARVDHGEGWHASLLTRMAHPFPGVRMR